MCLGSLVAINHPVFCERCSFWDLLLVEETVKDSSLGEGFIMDYEYIY